MTERRLLPKPPRMEIDEPCRIWMTNYARKNYWRVAAWVSIDDLIQDGYLTWYRIVSGQKLSGPRQPGEPVSSMVSYQWITDRPHIMSLFKTAYMNYVTDLANGRTNRAPFEIPVEDYMDAPDTDTACALIIGAPKEVQAVLQVLNTEEGREELAADYPVRADGTRETTNERFQRLTGLTGKITKAVRTYFEDTPIAKRAPKPEMPLDAYAALRRAGKSPLEALAASNLQKLAGRIATERGDSLRTASSPTKTAVTCGHWLIEAKELCKKQGLSFVQWIIDNCKFCASTARKYMWLARRSSGVESILSMSLAAAKRYICALAMPAV